MSTPWPDSHTSSMPWPSRLVAVTVDRPASARLRYVTAQPPPGERLARPAEPVGRAQEGRSVWYTATVGRASRRATAAPRAPGPPGRPGGPARPAPDQRPGPGGRQPEPQARVTGQRTAGTHHGNGRRLSRPSGPRRLGCDDERWWSAAVRSWRHAARSARYRRRRAGRTGDDRDPWSHRRQQPTTRRSRRDVEANLP